MRKLECTDRIVFFDSYKKPHNALVTNVFGNREWDHSVVGSAPCINLLYVTDDASREDGYGRQIERQTSMCHRQVNPAGAMCWVFEDEV